MVPRLDCHSPEPCGTASMPLRSIRVMSFSEGPPGFLSPISHFCTVGAPLLGIAAKTGWLTGTFWRSGPMARAYLRQVQPCWPEASSSTWNRMTLPSWRM